jgi:MFS family permease
MDYFQSSYRDIWKTTLTIKLNQGFGTGLTSFIYRIFLFEHFGANGFAIKFVALLVILNSLFTLLLEVPTGAIGDYIGRKKAVILSFIFVSLCFLFKTSIYFSPELHLSMILAIAAEILNAIGYAFFSGTFFAWLVDSVRTNSIEEGHGPLIAKGTSYTHVGRIVGSAISLTAYLLGHVYLALLMGFISYGLVAVYCGVTMKETEKMTFYGGGLSIRQSLMRMKEIVKIGFSSCVRIPPILYLTMLNAIAQMSVYAVLFLWGIAMKVSFGIENMNFYWYLIVFGSFASAFIGARLVNKLHTQHFQNKMQRTSNQVQWNWVIAVCLFLSTSIIGLGLCKINDLMTLGIFIGVVIAVNFSFGFLWPAINALFNYFIPEDLSPERATIMSFSSMVTELFMIILFYPASGTSGEKTVLGWMIPASILLGATVVLNFLMKRYEQKTANASVLNPINMDRNPQMESI